MEIAGSFVDNPGNLKFTPVDSGIGGMLVGLACTLCMLEDGRVCGISGIYGEFIRSIKERKIDSWSSTFIFGLAAAGVVNFQFNRSFSLPGPLPNSAWVYFIVGAISGVGTLWGNGCTSGHGIVGLSRFNFRSFVAVCVFMAVGFLTVNGVRLASHDAVTPTVAPYEPPQMWTAVSFGLGIVVALLAVLCQKFVPLIVPLACGLIFGLGLGASGMSNQHKVLGFLNVSGVWDPSLAFVMGGALAVGLPSFARMRAVATKPLRAEAWAGTGPFPMEKGIDGLLVAGNVLFGISWGLLGICPGPAVLSTVPYLFTGLQTASSWYFLIWMAAFGLSRTIVIELRQRRTAAAASSLTQPLKA